MSDNLRLGRWYVVTWHDAYASLDTDWKKLKSHKLSPLVIQTAGKLVKRTKRYATFAQCYDTHSGKVSCLMSVPLGMMTKVRRVKP